MSLLSDEDMKALTGASQTRKQIEILERHGIFYILNNENRVVTTWHHVNHPFSGVPSNDDSPNLEAI